MMENVNISQNRGIIIFGAPGAGTSTVGRALAKELGYNHIETDDISGKMIYEPPFRISYTTNERISRLNTALDKCSNFVISGSMWDWGDSFIHLFDLAVFITTPTNVRIERLEQREKERHGERICDGGDIHDRHKRFVEWAKTYDTDNPDRSLKLHEQWIDTLHCPVLRINGTLSVANIVAQIIEQVTEATQRKTFWDALDKFVSESSIVIDRPKGSRHPKYPEYIYPLDYGYLESTSSMDGGGIDVWKGSAGDVIDAIICTVDLLKKDSEIKILIGCNEDEKQLAMPTNEYMKGILIRRDEYGQK